MQTPAPFLRDNTEAPHFARRGMTYSAARDAEQFHLSSCLMNAIFTTVKMGRGGDFYSRFTP